MTKYIKRQDEGKRMLIDNSIYARDILETSETKLPWEQLKNKKILITGASGLIGTFLIDMLMYQNRKKNLGMTIYAVGRSRSNAEERFGQYWNEEDFQFLNQDMNQPFMQDVSVDYMIHAASNTHPNDYAKDPIGTITTNVLGTHFLLSYAKQHKIQRFMLLSSVEIYGKNVERIPKFNESQCGYIDCNTLRAGYPESKRVSEALCQAYMADCDMDIVIARLSRTYGPTMKMSDSKANAQFLKNALQGEDIVLKSKGTQMFSYIYVADAVSALLTILLKGKKGEAYNIADEQSDVTLAQLAQITAACVGKSVVFDLPDAQEAKGFSTADLAVLDAAKLNALGWHAVTDIQSGVEKTIKILKGRC